ncbi:hypothetical protein SCWH03_03520 [Streptomyces pacificus]|uniref:Uncharacterized protein n=1 Tax=Streptomyces pacificus TaxID=2705029 RepID=A0A6A0AMT8_9ACTN|nr:hypothetical protein SCWH03_03520 [Streptomyces pacificus]
MSAASVLGASPQRIRTHDGIRSPQARRVRSPSDSPVPVGRADRDGSREPGAGAARPPPRSGGAAGSRIPSCPTVGSRPCAVACTAAGSRKRPGGGPPPARGASEAGKRAWARNRTADGAAVHVAEDALDGSGAGPFPGRNRCRR